VQSVHTSEQKVVFVVSGPCELLLDKPVDASGSNAQDVTSVLDQAVIVLYRTHEDFSTEEAWSEACKGFNDLVHRQAHFQTASTNYSWKDGDLTLVSTEHLQVEIVKP
jgi:20S proteasome alpha/beta subunit